MPAANSMRTVLITAEPIELCKVMKFENLVHSGGAAKQAITSGHVQVNGAVETRRRKKLYAGDTITFNNETLTLALE